MCEKCVAMAMATPSKRGDLNFDCSTCGVDTSVDRGIKEWYMIDRDVWRSVARDDEMLCIGCLEKRLKRELNSDDFFPSGGGFRINAIMPQSKRLRNRMERVLA